MHVSNRWSQVMICSAALIVVGGCARKDETSQQVSNTTDQAPPQPIGTQPWIDDVHVSSAEGVDSTSQGLTPGTELQLSMSVEHAPQGTDVTAYWYGPENRQLAYETQTVEPKQRQMNFKQENTYDWAAGTYRAEVWVGGDKIQEQTFQIVPG